MAMEDKSVDGEIEAINREINSLKLPEGAPPKARVPYMRYYHEVFHSIKAANTALRLPEIGKIIGSQWKALPDSEKQRYTRGYEDDKRTFGEAMKVFQITSEYQQYSRRKEDLEHRRKKLQNSQKESNSNAAQSSGQDGAKPHAKQHAAGGRASLSRPTPSAVNGNAVTNGSESVKMMPKPPTSPSVSMPLHQYGSQQQSSGQHYQQDAPPGMQPITMQIYHQRQLNNSNQMMTPPPQIQQQHPHMQHYHQQSGWPTPVYAGGPSPVSHSSSK